MHISLDAALQRQPLLSTVGDKLLPSFPGAAAAYSLRSLNGDANDAVRVRRDADNEERDFTAEGVSLELEDWVNGKLETTLPADVDTAAAAYSLRKVKADYTGNAVRIRRASDDVEVNVAFDTNGEVSDSSAVTNIPSNFPTTEVENGIPSSVAYDTLTPDGLTGFSASTDAAARCGYAINNGTTGEVVSVTVTIADYSGSGSLLIRLRNGLDATTNASNTYTITGNGTYSFDLTATADFSHVLFVSSADLSFTASGVSILSADQGDTTATTLGGFLTEGGNQDAYVQTWYDQSGNGNDATQNVAGSQPKIAEAGALLGEIAFDGSDDFLSGNHVLSANNLLSVYAVAKYRNNTARQRIVGDVFYVNDSNNGGFAIENDVVNQAGIAATFSDTLMGTYAIGSSSDINVNNDQLSTLELAGGTLTLYHDGASVDSTSAFMNAEDGGANLQIGGNVDGSAALDGTIKELIIYNSDQSSNRFKIESNINNYYQLDGYKVQYEYDLTTGNGGFEVASGCTITTNEVVGGRDECLKATSTAGSGFNLIKDGDYPSSNGSYVIEGEVYLDPSNVSLKKVSFQLDSSSGRGFEIVTISDTGWSNFRFSFDTTSVADDFQIVGRDASGSVSFARTAGDFFAIRNVKAKYADNGFVHTWYDQSGNGNHAEQLTLSDQPTIVNAGSLLGELSFDGVDDVLEFTQIPLSSSYAMFGVFDNSALPSDFIARSAITSNSYISLQPDGDIFWETDTNNDGIVNVNIGTPASGINLLSCLLAASGTGTAFLNGTSGASASFANTNLTVNQLGGRGTTIFNEAKFKEIIIYNSDQSANRSGIESNIADEYGITLP